MLKPGDAAPDFDVLTDEGTPLKLSDMRGKTVILYFYPRADTPGCTKEACSFRDSFPRFTGTDAVVLGASPDDVKAQAKFKETVIHRAKFAGQDACICAALAGGECGHAADHATSKAIKVRMVI